MTRRIQGLLGAAAIATAGVLLWWLQDAGTGSDARAHPMGLLERLLGELESQSIGVFGRVVNGQFEEMDSFPVWEVESEEVLDDVHPSIYLHAQFERPAAEFSNGPPATMMAHIVTCQRDGTPFYSSPAYSFVLVGSDSGSHIYRSQKPLILMGNPKLAGERRDLIAILGAVDGEARILLP
jgi:hypothetical protein